ncbi:MAG: response regulator [Campylobacterales bacterium]|nr:response regulator [Campylobacterales bacterium]
MERYLDVKKNILVADDNPVMRKIIKSLIQKKFPNSIFFEANDGQEVLDFLEFNDIDWAFLDWHMPEINGNDIVKKLKKEGTFPDLKIVMVTAESDKTNIMELLRLERISNFISKPVKGEKIDLVLKGLLE